MPMSDGSIARSARGGHFLMRLAVPERCRIWEGVEESVRLRRNIQKFRRLWRTRATEPRVNYLVLP